MGNISNTSDGNQSDVNVSGILSEVNDVPMVRAYFYQFLLILFIPTLEIKLKIDKKMYEFEVYKET